jgi:hypothetical protein
MGGKSGNKGSCSSGQRGAAARAKQTSHSIARRFNAAVENNEVLEVARIGRADFRQLHPICERLGLL